MSIEKVFKKLRAESIIDREMSSGNLSHAILFVCEDYSLARRYSFHVAKKILGNCNDCGKCESCKLVSSNSHPDFFFYPKVDMGKIVVDDVLDILDKASLLPIISNEKVFVINGLENMNETAQNKLLKILEEPPKSVHFILTTSKKEDALMTIRSRCEVIFIDRFSAEDIYTAIEDEDAPKDKLKLISALSDGLISKAYVMLDSDEPYKITDIAISVISSLNSVKDMLSTAIMFNDVQEKDLFYAMITVYRDMLLIKNGASKYIVNINKKEEIKNLCEKVTTCSIIESIDKVNNAIARTKSYATKNTNVDTLLMELLEVKYNCIR